MDNKTQDAAEILQSVDYYELLGSAAEGYHLAVNIRNVLHTKDFLTNLTAPQTLQEIGKLTTDGIAADASLESLNEDQCNKFQKGVNRVLGIFG